MECSLATKLIATHPSPRLIPARLPTNRARQYRISRRSSCLRRRTVFPDVCLAPSPRLDHDPLRKDSFKDVDEIRTVEQKPDLALEPFSFAFSWPALLPLMNLHPPRSAASKTRDCRCDQSHRSPGIRADRRAKGRAGPVRSSCNRWRR